MGAYMTAARSTDLGVLPADQVSVERHHLTATSYELRARRRDPLRERYWRGDVDPCVWLAVVRWRTDLETAAGARDRPEVAVRGGSPDWHPTARQIDAQTRCRRAACAIGLAAWPIVFAVAIGGYGVQAAAKETGTPERLAERRLSEALDRLATMYGAEKEIA